MSEFGKSDVYGERMDYENNKCQDAIWSILYWLNIIGVAIGIGYIYGVDIPNINNKNSTTNPIKSIDFTGFFVCVLISIISGLIIGFIWLQVSM